MKDCNVNMEHKFWIFSIFIFILEVSAHPPNRNYLLRQRSLQDSTNGGSSSKTEISFHPLEDLYDLFSGETNFPHHHNPEHHIKRRIELAYLEPEEQHQRRIQTRDIQGPKRLALREKSIPSPQPPTELLNRENNNYGTILQGRDQQVASAGRNDISSKWESRASYDDDFGEESDADAEKRNAFHNFKRQKLRSQQQFIPSISVGAITHLGDFFDNLKSNVEVLEKGQLTEDEAHLLSGDHPVSSLQKELNAENMEGTRPSGLGTAAFLHAIRTYRPSQRVRALVSMNPTGYHGSNYLDPNYMWLGLGK